MNTIYSKLSPSVLFDWNKHNRGVSKAVERLSSGLKLNSAADDPSGVCISERMKLQISQLREEQNNISSKISSVNTADSAMADVSALLVRLNELAVKGADGLSATQADELDREYQSILAEIDRVGRATYSDFTMLGSAGAQGSTRSVERITMNANELNAYLDRFDSQPFGTNPVDAQSLQDSVLSFSKEPFGAQASVEAGGKPNGLYVLTITNDNLQIERSSVSSEWLNLDGTNLRTKEDAANALTAVKSAIDQLSSGRSELGSTQNRLEHTFDFLQQFEQNLSHSVSRITDADMAREVMNLTCEQMLSQVSAFVMSQNHQSTRQVLNLLLQ